MWIALVSVLATLAVVLLVANLGASEKKIERRIDRHYGTADAPLRRALGSLLGPPIVDGNDVRTLLNGDAIFPPMLEAISGARRTVCFETYIYWSGTIGRDFADALIDRARAGVAVHVLLDWAGSVKMDERYLREMRDAGVEVERYHKPHWSHLPRLNNRTHRKLLVVDGETGFTGGVGIADQWRGHAEDAAHWRDTHFRVQGPVVAQMQAVFMDNWIKATGRVLHGDAYFPPLRCAGTMAAQMFSSSPTGGSESMHLMYLLALTAASESIELASSYFVPDRLAVNALAEAARRGARVRVLVPGRHIDARVVRRASRALWGGLLEAGVEVAEYRPTMLHTKVLVVDRLLVSVGSTNFDNRSFRLNDEANLNIIDATFAAEQARVFDDDWRRSQALTLDDWRRRPWHEKLLERTAALLRTQL